MKERFLTYSFSESDINSALCVYRAQERYTFGVESHIQARDMVVHVTAQQIIALRHLFHKDGARTVELLKQKIPARQWRLDLVRSFLTLIADPSSLQRPYELVHLGLWQDLTKEYLQKNLQLHPILNRFMIPANVLNERELKQNGTITSYTLNG